MDEKKKKNLKSSALHTTKEEIGEAPPHGPPSTPRYRLAYTDLEFLLREELRPVRLQLELLRPELVLNDHDIDQALVFFGSAKTPDPNTAKEALNTAHELLKENPTDSKLQQKHRQAKNVYENSRFLEQATRLAYLASTCDKAKFVVLTGGGPSFMEAANLGAHQANARSVALNMLLSAEQFPNPYITPELTFQFHYFAIRKMHFLMRAKALVAFPGGYGTLDELFEVLTLMQHKKIERIPLLLFHEKFWRRIINFEGLVAEGTIDEDDLDLFTFVETANDAWQHILDFYDL